MGEEAKLNVVHLSECLLSYSNTATTKLSGSMILAVNRAQMRELERQHVYAFAVDPMESLPDPGSLIHKDIGVRGFPERFISSLCVMGAGCGQIDCLLGHRGLSGGAGQA